MPDEVRAEIGPFFVDTPPVIAEDGRKLTKLDDNSAEHIRSGLTVSYSLPHQYFFFFCVVINPALGWRLIGLSPQSLIMHYFMSILFSDG